jgi:dolichol-phosphate mannosyltransferase
MTTLDVVIPVYQNAESLRDTCTAIAAVLGRDAGVGLLQWRLIFVDDGSTDASWAEIQSLASDLPAHVTGVRLLRNFGQVAAILAGMKHSSADAIVVVSADLQDPPELIERMIEDWRAGWKIVLATRVERADGVLRRWTSGLFYRLIRRHGVAAIPPGGFDFFLIDREVVRLLLESGERHRFLQGDLLWFGFDAKAIPYARKARPAGRSQWSLARRLNYFVDAFVGYSYAPIRLASHAGLALLALAALAVAGLILQRIFLGTQAPGWTSLMIVMIGLNALQFLVLGIFGEYLWRHMEMTRARPQFLVSQVIGAAKKPRVEDMGQESGRNRCEPAGEPSTAGRAERV